MGTFEVKAKLTNLATPSLTEEISLLVDTRATLSQIPIPTLERLGVRSFSRLPFCFADGQSRERETGMVLLTIGARKAPVPVSFAETGERGVLGLTGVEALGFEVDRVARKLIPRNLRNYRLRRAFLRRFEIEQDGTNGACGAYS